VLETLMGVIGSQVAPRIYGATVGTLPSAVFLVSAVTVLPAGFLLCGLPPFEEVVEKAQTEQRQLTAKLLSGVTGEESETLSTPP